MLETHYLAAIRTLLAAVRTGGSIAGGGALVTNLLVKGWPHWIVVALSSAFVILGYSLMWSAMARTRELRAQFERESGGKAFLYPHRGIIFTTVVLQVLIAIVLALYLIRR
jgi:hypothetical protein